MRLDVYPDGGISRLRLHGTVADPAREPIIQRWHDLLPPNHPAELYFD